MNKNELLKGITDEQIEKIKQCKNGAEVLALAKEEGVELTDEQLSVVTGGGCGEGGPKDIVDPKDDTTIIQR